MKFLAVVSLATLAVAVPTVDLVERQTPGSTSSAAANACKQQGGKVLCCDPQATKLSGLLGLIPQLTCVGIIVNPEAICGSAVGCCTQQGQQTNQAVIQILPGAIVCPTIAA